MAHEKGEFRAAAAPVNRKLPVDRGVDVREPAPGARSLIALRRFPCSPFSHRFEYADDVHRLNFPMPSSPRSSCVRFARLALAAAAAVSFSTAVCATVDVELLVDSDPIAPSTTFELRFSQPMVSRDLVGSVASPSPLLFDPPLPGEFTWLSTRSGVFTPSTPTTLSTMYSLSLHEDLRDAAGKPLNTVGFTRTVSTPAFGPTRINGKRAPGDNGLPQPEVSVAWNAPIDLESVSGRAYFRSEHGGAVPAKVRYATPADYFPLQPEDHDWQTRWDRATGGQPPGSAVSLEQDESKNADAETQTFPARLVFVPDGILAPGASWQLEIPAGATAAGAADLRLAEALTVSVGRVAPFTVEELLPQALIRSGRSLTIRFSEPIAPDIDAESAAKFVRFEPPVDNLSFEEGWDRLVVRGNFELGRTYRVEFDPETISRYGLPLAPGGPREFVFEPVKPRLYLPTIAEHQFGGGRRTFDVLTVNLSRVTVQARAVSREDVPAAIAAFENYNKRNEHGWIEPEDPYQPLTPENLPGKRLAAREIDLPDRPVDETQTVSLNWDDWLGDDAVGAVFLTVDGVPTSSAHSPQACGAQALVQVTDLGALWKETGDRIHLDVFSMATAAPLSGVSVRALDKAFAELGAETTNAGGAVSLPASPGLAWIVLGSDGDSHTIPLGDSRASELPSYGMGVRTGYREWGTLESEEQPYRAFLFTDRPLYRPGDTVYAKGLLRRADAEGLAVAGGVQGELVLSDPEGERLVATPVIASERGALDAALVLPPSRRGRHNIVLELNGERVWDPGFTAEILVADFEPDAFEVAVSAPKTVSGNEPFTADISGSYLFGGQITTATIRWTLEYVPTSFSPEGFEEWSFGAGESSDETRKLTLSGESAVENGRAARIEAELPPADTQPGRGVLTVEVTDINQQTVTRTIPFVRKAAQDFQLGLPWLESRVRVAGQPLPVRPAAVGPNGRPLGQPREFTAELLRNTFRAVRVKSAGGAVSFRTDKTSETVATTAGRTMTPQFANGEWMAPAESAAQFTPEQPGQYTLRVSARDDAGREAVTEQTLFVSGNADMAWDYRNPAQIDLEPDRALYAPEDVAKVLVKTPFGGRALVSVERGGRVLRTMETLLEGNTPAIEIPLEHGDTPNVSVAMVVLRGARDSPRHHPEPEYRFGLCNLPVRDPAAPLRVDVLPRTMEVEPGQPVEIEVAVRDGAGAPAADAEVALWAVDDGILALTGYERPSPLAKFYDAVPLSVRRGVTLLTLLAEDPAELAFSNKGYLIGGGGLEVPGLKVRTDFPATPLWQPALRTDKQGMLLARLTAPDALTRYRVVAAAHRGAGQFGSGESAFVIRKPLMLLPSNGPIARVGDEIAARAVLRNQTGARGKFDVTLQLDDTAQIEDGGQLASLAVEIDDGASAAIEFPVRFIKSGEALWRWQAAPVDANLQGAAGADAVETRIRIGYPGVALREVFIRDLDTVRTDLLHNVNPQIVEGEGRLRVTLSNTRLASLDSAARLLLEYPYGCAEQTLSALLPWTLASDLREVMPSLAVTDEEAAATVAKSVADLARFQTPSGGMAFWPGGSTPSLYASAYAVVVLKLAKDSPAAAALPAPATESLMTLLSNSLRNMDRVRHPAGLEELTLAAYGLALHDRAEPAYHERLFERRNELNPAARAFLALAMQASNGDPGVIRKLLDSRQPAPEEGTWYGGAARERALALLATVAIDQGSDKTGALVAELLSLRSNGAWQTTHDTAWALLALSRYAAARESKRVPVSGTLVVNGVENAFALDQKTFTKAMNASFDAEAPLSRLEVLNPKGAQLFGEVRFEAQPPSGDQPRQDRGFAVSRSYFKLDSGGNPEPAQDLRVGDRVLVQLRVSAQRPAHFVAIDDPLPAMFEAVNPAFTSKAVSGADNLTSDYTADHTEIRDDRVLYFCDHLPAGEHTFTYLARVRSAGRAIAPQTKAEEMYRPERFGLGETAWIESKAE